MTKEELIAKAAVRGGVTQREIRHGLNAVIEILVEAFENDTNVAIAGLGTFQVKKRSNVKKYIPEDGKGPVKGVKGGRAMHIVPDRKAIKFTPSPYIDLKYMDRKEQRPFKIKEQEKPNEKSKNPRKG